MTYLMGIDLGTSSLKVLVATTDGRVLVSVSEAYSFDTPFNGYAEQNPEIWWIACRNCIRKALSQISTPASSIRSIGFSGQMHGLVTLDASHQVIRPAILHCDGRSVEQVESIKSKLGRDFIAEQILNPVYTGFLLPSLLWIRDREPSHYEKIRYCLLPKDYLRFRLTGEVRSDYSDASATLAYDIRNNCWSDAVLSALGIDPSIFPECVALDEPAGVVSRSAADDTGLFPGTLVVAGGADQVMQSIGNGVSDTATATINIGTSGQVCFQSDHVICNPRLNTNTFCGFEPGRWITMGAIMSAGLSFKWITKVLGASDYRTFDEEIDRVRPGSGGLLFQPYLNGERTPHVNPNLSAAFLGLNLNTGRPEMARAVLEGVTYALNECIDACRSLGLSADRYVASGGGSQSPVWLQIQADIFGVPLQVAKIQEQAAIGAAIAAGVGASVFADIEEGCKSLVFYQDTVYYPDSRRHAQYKEYYSLYKEAYSAGGEVLQKITELGRSRPDAWDETR